MKVLNFIVLIGFAGLLIYASFGLPNRGDAHAPLYREKSLAGTPNAPSYYVHNPEKDAETPNMVTVILADYRGYDTMGEETVILTAGLICYLILRRNRKDEDDA
ncbi:MAG: hydrogen gas-evolving membrane-bound hydrogenase subunit E [Candidatus Aminicenantales bacterium]